jgi:hypothetical protein
MSGSVCVPGPVIVPFTQQDPPKSEAIQTAVNLILGGFEKHRNSINCTNDRIDQLIEGGASLLTSLNSGPRIGPRPNLNFIEGSNVTLQLNEDGPNDEFDLTISVPGLTGTVTNGANVGTGGAGVGLVFRDKTGTILNFRALAPLSPLLGLTLGDQVLLALVINPVGAGEAVGSNRLISGTSPIRINGGSSSTLQNDIVVSYRFNPRTKTEFWEDFVGLSKTPVGTVIGQNGWITTVQGVNGIVIGVVGQTNRPGVVNLLAATTGVAFLVGDGSSILCQDAVSGILIENGYDFEFGAQLNGVGEFAITGNRFIYRAGLGNIVAPLNDPSFAVHFEYDPLASANWLICTSNGGTPPFKTKTDSGVAATNNWTAFRIVISNPGTLQAQYFINGTSVGVVTTNIPVAVGRTVSPMFKVGAAAVVALPVLIIGMNADYFWYENPLISR